MKEALVLLALFLVLGDFRVFGFPSASGFLSLQYAGISPWEAVKDRLEFDRLKDESNGVFSLIPRNDGYAVADYSMCELLRKYDPGFDFSNLDCEDVPQSLDIDMAAVPGLVYYGMVDDTRYRLNDREKRVAEGIVNGSYGMVLVGPAGADTHLARVWDNVSMDAKAGFCAVYLPAVDEYKTANHLVTLFLRDRAKCGQLLQSSKIYLAMVFDGVCVNDEWIANNLLKRIYEFNSLKVENGTHPASLGKTCLSKKDLIGRMELGNKNDPRPLAILVAVLALLALHKKKDRKRVR